MKRRTMKNTTINFNVLIIIVFSLSVGWPATVFGGKGHVLKKEKLMKINEPASSKVDYKAYLKKSSNPLEGTASLLFLGYKSFFSSQDMNTCVFTPSCSVYAIESLQNDNPIKAYLKIFDRLQRCQPFVKQGEYEFVFQTQLYHDPAH